MKVKVGTAWRHTKTGNIYTVVGNCMLEANWIPAVLYLRADGSSDRPIAREVGEFLDRFEPIRAFV